MSSWFLNVNLEFYETDYLINKWDWGSQSWLTEIKVNCLLWCGKANMTISRILSFSNKFFHTRLIFDHKPNFEILKKKIPRYIRTFLTRIKVWVNCMLCFKKINKEYDKFSRNEEKIVQIFKFLKVLIFLVNFFVFHDSNN